MKFTCKRVLGAHVVIVVAFIAYASITPMRIRSNDRGFTQIGRGLDEARVIELMGKPDSIDSSADSAWWEDEGLPGSTANQVRRQYRYHVSTFFLPISWTIGFDKDGRVISKHRWD